MKQVKLLSLLCLSAVVLATSCSKDDDNNPPATTNVVDVVSANPSFSLLAQAITRAGLADALRTSSDITVFAPDNDAFAASGIDANAINTLSPDTLAAILRYHVVGARVSSSQVPQSDTVGTLLGRNLYASSNANGVFVNGIKVKQADLNGGNATIHVISKVLIPPTQTIAQVAAGNPDFSILLAAVVKAGLADAVSKPGKYTVFAPTNAAFTTAGFPTPASINGADNELISTVVKYHVLTTNVFASDLTNNANVATLQGGNINIVTTPPSLKIATSEQPYSNITAADIVTTNGVIHVIDRVLLP